MRLNCAFKDGFEELIVGGGTLLDFLSEEGALLESMGGLFERTLSEVGGGTLLKYLGALFKGTLFEAGGTTIGEDLMMEGRTPLAGGGTLLESF